MIKSWSYSRYAAYKECPAKAKYKFVDKLPEPPAPAMERGNQIHKAAEEYTKGNIPKLPKELQLFEDQFSELKISNPKVEETWCFTDQWHETVWNDWNNCWLRIKVDATCVDGTTLYIIDHKTGKLRDGYDEQLSLYALGGILKHPHIKKISTQMWFLDSGDIVEKDYSPTDYKTLKTGWEAKVRPMLTDMKFNPRPSNACRFCAFSKSKGGPCRY